MEEEREEGLEDPSEGEVSPRREGGNEEPRASLRIKI